MPSVTGFGDILGGLFDVKPETLSLIQQGQELALRRKQEAANEAYRTSMLGLSAARIQAEMERIALEQSRANRPLNVAPGGTLIDPTTRQPIYTSPLKPERPVSVAPGGTLIDPTTGKSIFTAPPRETTPHMSLPRGMMWDPTLKQIVPIPGYVEPGEKPPKPTFDEYSFIHAKEAELGRKLTPKETEDVLKDLYKTKSGSTTTGRLGAELGATVDESRLRPAAVSWLTTGAMPLGFTGSIGMRLQVMDAARDMLYSHGLTEFDIPRIRAQFHADQGELVRVQGQRGLVTSFMGALDQHLGLVKRLASKDTNRTGVPAIDRWYRLGRAEVEGDEDVNNLNASIRLGVNEFVRVTTSATGAGGMTSDAARAEGDKILNGSYTPKMILSVIDNVFINDMKFRQHGYDVMISNIQKSLSDPLRAISEPRPIPDSSRTIIGKDGISRTVYHFKEDNKWHDIPVME